MEKEILKTYTEEISCRFFRKQKDKCINQLIEDFNVLGYENDTLVHSKLLSKTKDIVFGNLKQAKMVISVPYDTQMRIFSKKYRYYPFDLVKSHQKAFVPTFFPLIAIYAVALIILEIVGRFAYQTPLYPVYAILMATIFLLLLYFAYYGFPNKNNTNMYSASLVTAISIASKLTNDQKRNVAFVFTDKNSRSRKGDKLLENNLIAYGRTPLVLSLSTIGKGEEIVIGYLNNNRKSANAFIKCMNTDKKVTAMQISEEDMEGLPIRTHAKSLMIACGIRDENNNLFVRNVQTAYDKEADETLLNSVEEGVLEYIKRSF